MPESNELHDLVGEVATRARDAAYVAVGLGVLGIQRAQVRRQELQRQAAFAAAAASQLSDLLSNLEAGGRQIGEWLDSGVQLLEAALEPLEEQLPPPARALAGTARTQLCALGTQLRQVVAPEP